LGLHSITIDFKELTKTTIKEDETSLPLHLEWNREVLVLLGGSRVRGIMVLQGEEKDGKEEREDGEERKQAISEAFLVLKLIFAGEAHNPGNGHI
jgi:hypothetical protein